MTRPATPGAGRERLARLLRRRVLPLVGRPGRYLGGEAGAVRGPWREDGANVLLAFPDAYEIGMSHTGLRVLYSCLARLPDAFADLAFAPWPDMEEQMRRHGLPLFGLESRRPARDFDVLAFSVAYELSYTNLLTMVDLAGLPLTAAERGEGDPVVVAGGACLLNPTVLAPYLDLAFLGDGEETVVEIAAAVRACKREGGSRADLCDRLAAIDGAWRPGAGPVRSRVLADLDRVPPPDDLVPVVEAVHDRLSLEVMRGCARGCRFCQAGMVTRPVRERGVRPLLEAAARGVRGGGWNEVGLLSLSSSDYGALPEAVAGLEARLAGTRTNLVLPSLRVDSLPEDLYRRVSREAPAGFTFAPEAGSQRLRDVINKRIDEADVLRSAGRAFAAGARGLKLYFMVGLPTETDADLEAVVDLVGKVVALAPRGGSQVTVSVSPFAPKPHTPFQWAGQVPAAELARRNELLRRGLRRLKVKVSLRDPGVSRLEALLGLGDGGTARAVAEAWRLGARFDAWDEQLDLALWDRALATAGVDPEACLAPRDPAAPLPWDGITAGADREFLAREWELARRGETRPDCRLEGECHLCSACDGEIGHRKATRDAAAAAALPAGGEIADAAAAPAIAAAPAFDPRNAAPGDPTRERPRWPGWRRRAGGRCWYRAEYAKTGDARFLGHLDLQRQLQLALRRSGLPVAYSQGYHPHPLLKYGPPLPVGVAGRREAFDLALERDLAGWPAALASALPEGLALLRAVEMGGVVPRAIDKAVERTDYEVVLPPPAEGGPEAAAAAARVRRFLAAERWPWLRRRPRGDLEVDARALVPADGLRLLPEGSAAAALDGGEGAVLAISLVRAPGAGGLPIHDFLGALLGTDLAEPRHCAITRLRLLARSPGGGWRSPFAEAEEAQRRLWLRRRLSA